MDKQTHKDVIQAWHESVLTFDNGDVDTTLQTLQGIEDPSAKILFNIGHVEMTKYQFEDAEVNFTAAIEKDPHMALAHFQLGMVNYHLHRYNESRNSYEKAKNCLRGNRFIDYRQLGFVHKLYECEVLYNLALTYATMMNNSEYALELLDDARKVSGEARHTQMIEKAEKRLLSNQLFDPILLPSNQIFRPPKGKVDGLKNVEYLGKAKVVSQLPESSNNNNETNFQVPKKNIQPSPNSFRPIDDNFSDDEDFSQNYENGGSSPTPSMVAKMTHKDTIATWYEGILAFDKGDIGEALNQLNSIIDPSAKILYDISILYMALGQLEDANSTLKEVVSRDPYLAIGHFQLGVVFGLLGRCDDAWHAFEKARETLRDHKMIDYKQTGLLYKLYRCEVLHNQAWAYNELDQKDWARNQLEEARDCKAEPRHESIEDSYRAFSSGRSFNLYQLPKPILYKPPKSKIDNLSKKDYLGKAKVVAKLPTVKRPGTATPPPQSSSSLGVPVLAPRSKTPTPSSAPPSKALPGRPVSPRQPRISVPESSAPWKMPTVTVDSKQSSRPPNRPPPSQTPPPSSPLPPRPVNGGRKISSELPPSRPIPSQTRRSPVPDRPLPASPVRSVSSELPPNRALPSPTRDLPPNRALPSPTRSSPVPDRPLPEPPGRQNSSEFTPPSRALPSPNRLSPGPDRTLPQRPDKSNDAPPSRGLPSPSRASPVRPVPQKPVPEQNGDAPPSRALPTPNRTSPPPERPLPTLPPKSNSPELPQRPLPKAPAMSDLSSRPLSLAERPVPPRPGASSPDLPSRPVPPPPGSSEPEMPPKPVPIVSRTSDLSNRTVPSSPNLGRKLPAIPSKNDSFDFPSRSMPPLPVPKDGPLGDLPSRPPPPKPAQSIPDLPPRPTPSSPIRQSAPESLASRPVPPPPATAAEPELPPRPKPSNSKPFQDRPVPLPPKSSSGRSASPGLPELPPPPPPARGPSPTPPRGGNKAKLIKIASDSPPVVRRAAAIIVTAKQEEKPTPVERAKPSLPSKPTAAANKPTPAANKQSPAENKLNGASNQPPILAFKPDINPRKALGVSQPGKRKTALVIASHQTDVEGELPVCEGDLVNIVGEAGDWLEVESKGKKGRIPRSCVKDFSKPGL